MRSDSGFTLIELLTIIGIISVLSLLGITNFQFYKSKAAYSSVQHTYIHTRNAIEAGQIDPDSPPPSVPLTTQASQGPIADATAAQLLPGLMLPSGMKFQISYDNGCSNGACQSEFVQINHCQGREFVRWVRWGDGTELLLEHVAGIGCS